MLAMLPMMFQSFDDRIGYPSFIPSRENKSNTAKVDVGFKENVPVSIPVSIAESTYTILPYRPFGTNPLGWAVSNVLLKGAEALLDLQEPELTAL